MAVHRRMYAWMDGWMDGSMDVWMDGWMDGWMAVDLGKDGCTYGDAKPRQLFKMQVWITLAAAEGDEIAQRKKALN